MLISFLNGFDTRHPGKVKNRLFSQKRYFHYKNLENQRSAKLVKCQIGFVHQIEPRIELQIEPRLCILEIKTKTSRNQDGRSPTVYIFLKIFFN